MRAPALATLTLLAAALAARAADSEPIPLPAGKAWVHEPTGFRFPPDVGTFSRVSAYRYDDEGRNVSVGYSDAALKVILTAYVNPNPGRRLADHFDQIKADVLRVHPKAELVAEGAWKLEQGGRKFTGRRAAFAFTVSVGAREQEVVSEAYLLQVGDQFVKFRVTCPKERYEAAAERVARFLGALKLPNPAAAVPE